MIKPRKTIEDITPYETDKYQPSWRLKLDSNENIYGCSNNIISAIKNIDIKNISLYPCYGDVIDKLASRYEVDYQNILITNGCDEALNIIVNAYIDKDDELLLYNPSFSMPVLYTKIAGGKIKYIDYSEKFVFNVQDVKNNISEKTKIFYLATPNNPTGETTKAAVVETLIREYQNILFLLDCTYTNFAQNVAFEDYIDLAKKYDNVVVVKSMSKDFALAGLRFGFIISNYEIIKNLKKVSSPYNVNIAALNCAMSALNDEKKFDEIKELNIKARELLHKGLKDLEFKPYPSEGNFILCDFGPYSDFYYEKLRKNGVIVRNYPKNSPIGNCLRITIPTLGGVKYILELLRKKDMLIFDMDGVIFDVRNSYTNAIIETFKYFSKQDISFDEVMKVKSKSGMNCDWDATKYLLESKGFNIDIEEIISVFQNLFYNPKDKTKTYLIDKEELLINKETFEKISEKYDLVIFSGRLKEEVLYSLKKYDLDKYFYYFVTSDDLPKNMLKPHPKGVLEILEHCPYKSVKYLGDSIDDIIAGNSAQVEMIGVISKGADYNLMVNNFKHLGVRYIIKDIKNIIDFLEDIEKSNAKTN